MARVPDIKRIRKEDFDSEYQGLVEKIAYSVNTFMDQVIVALSGNLDFTNINQQVVDYTISTDNSGNLINPSSIRLGLRSRPQGIICISATNVNNPNIFPTSQPFVSFGVVNNRVISIRNISGLQNNSTYRLNLLIIGA